MLSGHAQEVSALYKVKTGPLSQEDKERVGIVLNRYLSTDTLQSHSDDFVLASIAHKGQNVGGTDSGVGLTSTSFVQHTVLTNDTISGIASKYGLQSKNILESNPELKQYDFITVGQVLNIPADEPISESVKVAVATPARNRLPSLPTAPKQISVPVSNKGYLKPTNYTYRSQLFKYGHPGIDMAAPIGTPIYATKSGCMIKVAKGWNGGYGNLIIQDLGAGYTARYAHLTAFSGGLNVGDCVAQGQLIGYVGSTGRSTGPHLHFELRKNGVAFNPNL